jgi:hypothetical protein
MVTILTTLRYLGVLSDDHAAYVMWAWSHCDNPQQVTDESEWLALFTQAGFVSEIGSAERPASPMKLYRGAPEDGRLRWSWSEDRSVAERFAGDGGLVWVATVEPERLLGRTTTREEAEYVVDTNGLDVALAS